MQHARTLFNIALTLVTLAACSEAYACAACDSTLSKDWENQGISSKPGFTVDLAYSTLNQNRQRYGSAKASVALINNQYAAGQEVEAYTRTQTVTAALNYTSETFGLSIQLPFVNRTHGTYGTGAPGLTVNPSTLASSSDNSLGDVRVIGRYTGFSAAQTSGLIVGLKLPTGNTGATFSDGTTPLDAGLQIGTGSTDVIFGGYTSGLISTYGWFAQATLQHAVTTDLAIGGLAYRPGDAYTLNTGIRHAEFGAKVTPMLQLNLIKRQADTGALTVPTDPVTGLPVSGGTLAYLAPGASIRIGGGTSVYGFVQLPVYQSVNSLQIVPQYTLTLGVRHAFE